MHPICTIEDCQNKCRTQSSPYCEKHYYRLRRTGTANEKERKYSVNEKAFDRLNHDKCWLLGLIWSDGNISYNRLQISSKDKQMLDAAERIIGGSGCVIPHGKKYWALSFSNKRIVDKLRSLGLQEAKSLTIGWPQLSDSQEWHFMRGVFDGDGCAYLSRPDKIPYLRTQIVSASGEFFAGIRRFFDKHKIPYSVAKRDDGLQIITISKTEANLQIYNNFYKQERPCLHRKREVFEKWLDARGMKKVSTK